MIHANYLLHCQTLRDIYHVNVLHTHTLIDEYKAELIEYKFSWLAFGIRFHIRIIFRLSYLWATSW